MRTRVGRPIGQTSAPVISSLVVTSTDTRLGKDLFRNLPAPTLYVSLSIMLVFVVTRRRGVPRAISLFLEC
jgi:hypothetical protein